MVSVYVYPEAMDLYRAACQHILEVGKQAIARQGYFSLVLSGGSTPQGVYRMLGGQAEALDWRGVYFFWGDERCLPPDHAESNYRKAWEAMLRQLPVGDRNIFRVEGELPAERAALRYEEQIRGFFREQDSPGEWDRASLRFPSFDLILLGMGEDGHTASLFPGSPALAEKQRWVVGVEHDQPPLPPVDRVTLTLPLINAAREVVFLIAGAGKAARLEQVFSGIADPPLPAQLVQPVSGNLTWMVDQEAGVRLSSGGIGSPPF